VAGGVSLWCVWGAEAEADEVIEPTETAPVDTNTK
jgi:hypothetical protein